MSGRSQYAIMFTAREQAELVAVEPDATPLGPGEVSGRTVVSLVSRGTEVVGTYCGTHMDISPSSYPMGTGYAAVFEVEAVDRGVSGIAVGDLVFCRGAHRSHQRVRAEDVVRLPDGLSPETAVFARMVKIPMPSFARTSIRPPERLAVAGLGVVGLMAAQLGRLYGYETYACDPDPERQRVAREYGIGNVMAELPDPGATRFAPVGLGLECSGHEAAAMALCRAARVYGEVFLIGVPWVPRTDMLAQAILHRVFYGYVRLQSGWEGEMPGAPAPHSEAHHFGAALSWLAEGRMRAGAELYSAVSPAAPQSHYQDLLHNRTPAPTVLFDWRML